MCAYFSRKTKTLAIINTLRDVYLFLLSNYSHACGVAGLARVFNNTSQTLALRAGHLECHWSLTVIQCSFSSTRSALRGRITRFRFRSVAVLAEPFLFESHLLHRAPNCVLEAYRDAEQDILSFLNSTSHAHVKKISEILENILKASSVGSSPSAPKSTKSKWISSGTRAATCACLSLLVAGHTIRIVGSSFGIVAKGFVCAANVFSFN